MVSKSNKQIPVWSPGLVVLQWLSYAFWGLMLFAIAYVVYFTTIYYFDTSSETAPDSVAYGVAALLILFPIALVADIFWSRRESADKRSVPAVVMVIHAVLAALISLGSLVVVVFTSVSLLLTTTSDPTTVPGIITAAVLFVLFALLLARVARPTLLKKLRLLVRLKIAIVALVALGFAITGPVLYTLQTREDRAIRDSLSTINYYITQTASEEKGLPKEIDLAKDSTPPYGPYGYGVASNETASGFIRDGKITYQANTQAPTTETDQSGDRTIYYYRLCATFQNTLRDNTQSGVVYPYAVDSVGYQESLDLTRIVAGKKCFDLKTTLYKYLY